MHALEAPQISLKIYLAEGSELNLDAIIPVLHGWISDRLLDETVIDVADYRHLKNGPALLLAGLDANYYLDNTDGAFGMMYTRKRGGPADFTSRLRDAFQRVLRACELLEAEQSLKPSPQFQVRQIRLQINNRLLAPNDEMTYALIVPEVDEVLAELFPDSTMNISYHKNPRELFEVFLVAEDGPEESVKSLMGRL